MPDQINTTPNAGLSTFNVFGAEETKVGDVLNAIAGLGESNMKKIDNNLGELKAGLKTLDENSLPLDASKVMAANIRYKIQDRVNTPLDMRGGDSNGDALLITAGGLTVIGGGEFPQNYHGTGELKNSDENLVLGADSSVRIFAGGQSIASRVGMEYDKNGVLQPLENEKGSLGREEKRFKEGRFKALFTDSITGDLKGNAASATALATARNVHVNLASTGAASFNGTANITPGVNGVLPVANGGTGNTSGKAANSEKLNGQLATYYMPTGAVMPYAGAGQPSGWLFCNGQAVSRTTYAALFAVIGTTYGVGNGSTTFNVPNMVNRFPLGCEANFRGQNGGEEKHLLTVNEMPSHSHYNALSGGPETTPRSGILPWEANINWQNFSSTFPTGGGQYHNTMPPYTSFLYIIKV